MESATKIGIKWIISLIYLPIGLVLANSNNPFLVVLSFLIVGVFIILTIYYSRKE